MPLSHGAPMADWCWSSAAQGAGDMECFRGEVIPWPAAFV